MPFTPKLCCATAVLPVQQEALVETGPPGPPPSRPCTTANAPESRAGQLDRSPRPQALNLFLLCSVLHGALPLGTACLSLCLLVSLGLII